MITPIEQANILRVYYSASAAEVAEGLAWYDSARQFCEQLAVRYACSLKVAAGIVATLSPGASWEKNQSDAELVCAAFEKNTWVGSAYFPKVGTYGDANRVKCQKIWQTESEPTGQKVNAFYRCILGDYETVCVDRHAVSAMLMEPQELKLKEAGYQRAQAHYVAAAFQVRQHITPAQLQAVVWVVWRERSGDFL